LHGSKNIVQTGGVAERTPGDSGGPTRYPNSTTEAERRSNEDAKKRTAEARRQEEEARKAAEAKRADDDYRKRMGLNPRGDPDVEGPRWLAGVVDNPCTSKTVCTLVPIFFGTDRKQVELSHRTDFGPDRASKLQLGRAVVTVPRVPHRRVGEIIVPSNLERWFSKVPPEGDFGWQTIRYGVPV
jgi:hypothetical protein